MAVDSIGIEWDKQRDDHGGVHAEHGHGLTDRDDSGDGAGDDWKPEGRDRNSEWDGLFAFRRFFGW